MAAPALVRHADPAGAWELVRRPPDPRLRALVADYAGFAERADGLVLRRELPTARIPVILHLDDPYGVEGLDGVARNHRAGFAAGMHEVRGNGEGAEEALFYITSGGNTIRGLILSYFYRGIMIDGANAVGNKIIGNWIGFTASGTDTRNQFGVLINTGAKQNRIGTPDLADRNIIGNGKDGVNHYGPGTNGNITQNNVFCINPYGGDAYCSAAADHNFGPKSGLIGGNGPNERNVVGHTLLQAIEYSHGWNPKRAPRADTSTRYQINGNRLIGNWLGFKANGSYKKAWRSGEIGRYDNGQAVNVYDGANRTVVENNWMSSVKDGVTLAAPNSTGNIIRGNHIGISPTGEAAPMSGWGVKIRWVTSFNDIVGNTISNTGAGGVGFIDPSPYNDLVSRNIVTNTSGPAIHMTRDKKNPGMGSDALVPAPVITHASKTVISGNAIAGASVEVYRADRGVGANGLPVAFAGATTVDGERALVAERVGPGQGRPGDGAPDPSGPEHVAAGRERQGRQVAESPRVSRRRLSSSGRFRPPQ